MNRTINKYFMLCCTLTILIFLYGCGSGSSTAGSKKVNEIKQEETVYVTQDISLPEYASFDGAYSDGSDLHYAATRFNEFSQQLETAFYTLTQGAAEPEMNFLLEKNQRAQRMTMDEAGNIYYIGYEEIIQEESDSQPISDIMLYKVGPKGESLLALDLMQYTKGQEQSMIQDLSVDGENRIILYSLDQSIYVISPEGQLLFETRAPGRIYDVCSSNGKIFIGYADETGMAIRQVDMSGKELSAKLEYNIPGREFYMTANRNGYLFIATEESVYQYALETAELVKKFDWQTCDSVGITAGILMPLDENGVLTISRSYDSFPMKVEATAFREAADREAAIQEKTVIILGAAHPLPSGISAEVVYFNKTNPDVKIEVKSYGEDYIRLNTEITTGNGPDLLVLPSHKMNQFAEKGILEDLDPYFDEDETLNRGDFLENILTAFETEGQLRMIPLGFNIYTILGRTSLLGEMSKWNLDEMIDFTERFPEDTDIFDNTSKTGVLRLLKYAYSNQLVNSDNADNPLDRELLVKMLDFANRYENDDQYIHDSFLAGKIEEKQVILLDNDVYAGQSYFAYCSLFGEQVTFVGYPTEKGNGNLIYARDTFAINSGSEHKDVAWKFISTLLSEDAQIRMEKDYSTKGFHIRKNALEEHFTWLLNMGGSQVYWVETISDRDGYSYRDIPGKIVEEDINQVRRLIQNADTAIYVSQDIDEIIEEEAALYFDGTKPVEEVVDVIENRVRTYVNEMK